MVLLLFYMYRKNLQEDIKSLFDYLKGYADRQHKMLHFRRRSKLFLDKIRSQLLAKMNFVRIVYAISVA